MLVFVLLLDCFWCCSCFCFQGFFCCLFFFVFLFVFVCFVCFVCLCWSVFVVFVFSCCFFWFAVVLFFVLLEWSRCCSCFGPIPLERQHQQKKHFDDNKRGRRHIYIYVGELVFVPLFGLSRVSFGTTSRVRNSTTS